MLILAQTGELIDAAMQASDKTASQFLNFVFAIILLGAMYFLKRREDNMAEQTKLQQHMWKGDPAVKEDLGLTGWMASIRDDVKEVKQEQRSHDARTAAEHQTIIHKLNGGPKP